MGLGRWLVRAERAWDAARRRRVGDRPPEDFRIECYLGHGGPGGVVLRGRVLDDPEPSEAVEGEGVRASLARGLRHFVTDELPGVRLQARVGDAAAETETDREGYFRLELHPDPATLSNPWTTGTVELAADYRGLAAGRSAPIEVLVPGPEARFGVVSDVDDTILQTGVQRVVQMLQQTLAGSALTRTAFPGAAELYRDLAADGNPFFYVSSSPWNLHSFLVAFVRHRGFPLGPIMLRDLLGTSQGREQKGVRIEEILRTHPDLDFVLIGDSGEKDPRVYAETVVAHPDRILAVYIREVRLDTGDGRVEEVSDAWEHDVPFVLAADSDEIRAHAIGLGLL